MTAALPPESGLPGFRPAPGKVGSYIPDTGRSAKTHGSMIILANDADLDYGGLVDMTDRSGNDLPIPEFTGGK
jgi:hypothetical protein